MKMITIMLPIIGITFASAFLTPSYANKVTFPIGQAKGSFQCTTSKGTKINMDSHNVDVGGFCRGEPYVSKRGHLDNVPSKIMNKSFFQIQKKPYHHGYIDVYIASGKGTITCSSGHDSGRLKYGNGRYCMVKPEQN